MTFDDEFDELAGLAYQMAFQVLGSRADAEEIAQDTDEVNERSELQRLLRSLSRRQRDVVALRYLADMSEADVATELGISVGSVKTRAHRGIATLRGSLDATTPSPSTDSNEPELVRTETTDV